MTNYRIKMFAKAKAQVKSVAEYIKEELHAPLSAKNVTNDIKKAIASLKTMPERIPLVRFEPWRSRGFRCMTVRNYLIYFWIDETARQVNVIAVIYGKRDQMAQLETMMEK